MEFSAILGAWVAAFLTIGIFSYLYKDNPFYKAAEHLFVGVSAGYLLSLGFWTQLQPNLFGRLFPAKHYDPDTITYTIYNVLSFFSSSIFPEGGIDKGHDQHLTYLIPLALGVMMLLSLIPRFSWMARWGIAYVVGMAAGLKAYGYLNSNVLGQIKGTAVNLLDFSLPVFSLSSPSIFNNIIIFVGTICGLLYFYFSKEHKGLLGKASKIGIYFLMISFGASFGFAVMGRISLLIGRFTDLIKYSGSEYNYATFWVLFIIVGALGYAAYKEEDRGVIAPIDNLGSSTEEE
ncbi:hypothetical protein HOD84_02405 [bacterium]|jgi:hypothetical protein|nr:hypothetical protein [bacterium]MBT4928209.1 hypothetical protein [bacterium]